MARTKRITLNVFVAGGTAGLGRELAKLHASRGANVVAFGRNPAALKEVESEMNSKKIYETQDLRAVSLDLGDADKVNEVFRAQPWVPDILYCCAGGTFDQMSLFRDMEAKALDMCMRNNYFTAAYPALTALKTWNEVDKPIEGHVLRPSRTCRRIVFVSSVAALCGLPGYSAYSPTKSAIRGLADTLRLEAIQMSHSGCRYAIHCVFPANFISPGFESEQNAKLELTKDLEGSGTSIEELKKTLPTAESIAALVVAEVEKEEFAICDQSSGSSLLWANMVGPSPKRGLGILDSILSVVVGLFIWPVYRRWWERKCRTGGRA